MADPRNPLALFKLGLITRGCFESLGTHTVSNNAAVVDHTISAWDIEAARQHFVVWAANVGLYSPAHGSLDYRLVGNVDITNLTTTLLTALNEKLQSR
jgi:hypothetical protein